MKNFPSGKNKKMLVFSEKQKISNNLALFSLKPRFKKKIRNTSLDLKNKVMLSKHFFNSVVTIDSSNIQIYAPSIFLLGSD